MKTIKTLLIIAVVGALCFAGGYGMISQTLLKRHQALRRQVHTVGAASDRHLRCGIHQQARAVTAAQVNDLLCITAIGDKRQMVLAQLDQLRAGGQRLLQLTQECFGIEAPGIGDQV